MKITDIKIGNIYSVTKKQVNNTTNLIIENFPSFISSEYKELRDLKTEKTLYIKIINNVIVDITDKFNKAVNIEESQRNINFILDNN